MDGTEHNQEMVPLCISILPFRAHIVTFFFKLLFFLLIHRNKQFWTLGLVYGVTTGMFVTS